MKQKVLLLNQHNLPLDIMHMKKAIKKICKGKAEIVATASGSFKYEGKTYPKPIIMRMNYYINISSKKTIREYSKLNVWKRDKGICQYCGKPVSIKEYTVDHIHPKKLGGGNFWSNVVTACFPCNNKKDCKPLKESGMKLIKKPKVPNVCHTIEQTILQKFKQMKELKTVPHQSWFDYL